MSPQSTANAGSKRSSGGRGCSNGTSNSATMRPGRGDITSTRVLMNTASLIEWVMNSPAKPSAWNSSSVWSLRCSRVISSTAPNGSSNRNTGGLSVSVRASEQRIRMPPDRDFG